VKYEHAEQLHRLVVQMLGNCDCTDGRTEQYPYVKLGTVRNFVIVRYVCSPETLGFGWWSW
jgi:hypothetical protein